MPSAVGWVRKGAKASSRADPCWVDWSYEEDASGLMLSCVEGMLEPLVMSVVSWCCVERGGLWADVGSLNFMGLQAAWEVIIF